MVGLHPKNTTDIFIIFNSDDDDYLEHLLLVYVKMTVKYLLSFCFQLSALKGTMEAPAVDLLRLNTLRGTPFPAPKMYD